ncbi:agmatinase [Echinicola strongylocentroti]|uniref:Agmatinase n=1 Tax=Echinicola strongylocentroti TaxID=1795355 RepID=A0A2Z4IQJ3_9BACT|nr:agmatinase family protein [Echinicola strongylocentroti]AWW32908.1 agmatinase [Echinicola strongylocentroti]
MTTKKQIVIDGFDPNGVASQGSIFGLPFDEETASVIILPVPWEVTVSYSPGTANGPEAVLKASSQVDLFQDDIVDAWTMGIHMLPIPEELYSNNTKYRILAGNYIDWLERGAPKEENERFGAVPSLIDKACESMNEWVYTTAKEFLNQGKLLALVGGDHSTPLGYIKALSEKYSSFGVLQIDAHADLRKDYEGFSYSHASIAHNFLKIPQVEKLVQVGVRDYCEEEADRVDGDDRITTFYDHHLKEQLYEGKTWRTICDQVIASLPREIYITIDIDGLDPKLCPNTGTPVPGGFEIDQIVYLMKLIVKSGRKIIGFDLVEVSPAEDESEWDGNVGARILYRMSNLMGVSQEKLWWK